MHRDTFITGPENAVEVVGLDPECWKVGGIEARGDCVRCSKTKAQPFVVVSWPDPSRAHHIAVVHHHIHHHGRHGSARRLQHGFDRWAEVRPFGGDLTSCSVPPLFDLSLCPRFGRCIVEAARCVVGSDSGDVCERILHRPRRRGRDRRGKGNVVESENKGGKPLAVRPVDGGKVEAHAVESSQSVTSPTNHLAASSIGTWPTPSISSYVQSGRCSAAHRAESTETSRSSEP